MVVVIKKQKEECIRLRIYQKVERDENTFDSGIFPRNLL